MRRSAALLLALVAAAVLAAPASARPTRAAEAFVAAVERAEAGAAANVTARWPQAQADLARCAALIDTQVPASAAADAAALHTMAVHDELVVAPLREPLRRLVADLDAVRTSDRALRRGRAVWRGWYDAALRFPAVADPCWALAAWKAAGWAPAARPAGVTGPQAWIAPERGGVSEAARLRAAVTRLRALGVPPKRAAAFAGDGVFDAPGALSSGFAPGRR